MGVYAVTGSASGMGRAVVDKLTAAGHTVIGVDLSAAEVVADLSTVAGRSHAVRDVLSRAGRQARRCRARRRSGPARPVPTGFP